MSGIGFVYCFNVGLRGRLLGLVLAAGIFWSGIEPVGEADALAGVNIIIDAGHGGIDSGAEYNGAQEKNINLAISRRLGSILAERGAQVSFVREQDIDFYTRGRGGKRNDLLKRCELIDSSGASLFISIHCNASTDKSFHGAQVYFNPAKEASGRLAAAVQQRLRSFDAANRRAAKADGSLLLLKKTAVNGVLVESGFLSNEREAAVLKSADGQQQIAAAVADGIGDFIATQTDKST